MSLLSFVVLSAMLSLAILMMMLIVWVWRWTGRLCQSTKEESRQVEREMLRWAILNGHEVHGYGMRRKGAIHDQNRCRPGYSYSPEGRLRIDLVQMPEVWPLPYDEGSDT